MGDMGELGEQAAELHREIGRYARERGLEQMFTLGPMSAFAAQEFGSNAQHYHSHELLVKELKSIVDEHTKVLIKGSRSAKMDVVVRGLSDSGEQQ